MCCPTAPSNSDWEPNNSILDFSSAVGTLIAVIAVIAIMLTAILHLLNGNQGTKKLICLYKAEHALLLTSVTLASLLFLITFVKVTNIFNTLLYSGNYWDH